ncbi:MAG: TMEM165/GDT1 family protein [Bacillota bacterium]|nr:TMEM165/GDT1 family protein [Bacillota bacterium]
MLTAASAAFVTMFVAEMGDKSQLISLTMASCYPSLQVLTGAMVALAAVLGLAVMVGDYISSAVPHTLIAVIAGLVFIVMGLYNYRSRDERPAECRGREGFFQTMIMVFVAEFGDKTQLAAVFLVAGFGYPLAVFGGAMAAMLLNHLLAVFVGSRFLARINPRYIRIASSALFIIIGLIIIIAEIFPSP